MKDKELKNSFISEEDFNDKNDIETLDRELEFKIAMYRAIKFLKKWALSLVLSLILSVIFYVSLYSLLDTAITKWVLNPIPILIFVHLVVAMMYLFKYRYEEASYSGEEIERNCTVCGNMLEKYYCTECLKFDVRLKDARVLNDLLNLNPKRKPFFSYQIDGNKVVEISFKGCKLTTIPPLIGELKSLECLDLSENKLTEISVSIGNLTSLKSLSLNNNQLTTLPDSIGNLTSLKDLALYSNKLSTLPESIINLKSLTVLNIQDNIFTEFPKILKKVTSLKDLRIDKELQDEWYRIRFIREVFHFHDLGRIKDKRGMYLLFFTLTLFVFTLIILSLFFYFIFSIIIFFNYLFVQLFIGAIFGIFLSIHSIIFNWKKGEKVFSKRRERAPITVFISHFRKDKKQYCVRNLKENLKKRKEIREVYSSGMSKIPESQLILFIATKNSLNCDECLHELSLALDGDIRVISIKGTDITFEDLSQVDLRTEGHGYFNLKDYKGFEFDGDEEKLEEFCDELYEYIKQYKRDFNLFGIIQ